MNILLVTIGSHGDVHPFVGLGIALRNRGHDVTLITNGHFEKLAQSAGLKFVELGTDELFRQLITDPDLWHPTRGFDAVFLRCVMPMLEQTYEIIKAHDVPGETVVVASSLAFASRIAQEKLGIPTITAHLSPSIMRTVYDVPKLPGLFMPRWLPTAIKKMIWNGGDKYIIDPKLAPPINELRKKLGLDPVSGILRDWWHSPQLVLGLWPDWYGPMQPDWPPQTRLVGFPMYDETGITPMSDELSQWLSTGDAPIAFTAGSAMIHGQEFFQASVDSCAKLNRRGILLTRHADQIPSNLPARVRHVDYVPFGQLLPKCAALVHHGGIGTTAQALCAGVPQLIMPMSHDQFDNAIRVERLGVGRSIKRNKYRAAKVERKLRELVDVPMVLQACQQIAQRFEGKQALSETCELIEKLHASSFC